MPTLMTGKKALLEMLKAEGVEYIFGNPGTSEGPIIDALEDYPEFKYILTLQEGVAVGMGDAYARATGRAAFVSLHIDSGLANGISLMQDAFTTGTPMVVVSANYDTRKLAERKTDLPEMVRSVTKWSVELTHPDQIPSVMRRAFNEANSHPKGPVYVGLTSNALDGEAEMNIVPSTQVYDAGGPDPAGVVQAAQLLVGSERGIMIIGDRVGEADAVNEAVQIAELLGLPVYQAPGANVGFPTTHPQFMGALALRRAEHREVISRADSVLAVGADIFSDLFYLTDIQLQESTTLIHIDPRPGAIGRSEPTDIGILANPKLALPALCKIVKTGLSATQKTAIDDRRTAVEEARRAERSAYEAGVAEKWDNALMTPARMLSALSDALPENAVVLDDSVSSKAALRHYIQGEKPGDLIGGRGGAIGWGIGATMGAQCANLDRPVIGIMGDGSSMMTIQGLWTAANDNIPCVFVICNNGMYRVLKVNMDIYKKDILHEEEAGSSYLYMDFPTPFDVAAIANSMGVHGERITKPEEIKPALDRALASGKPALLDMVIDGAL
ncbi:MAG: thiamine pyrophosphate-binding protein [Dehalococcoidia bacterium]|jgi:benzoylformate decarboxylase|nr:thiamine pyrophosphate-binding protein [Dehalococcoidia bacterium]